jgi:hypothetical protein
MTNAGDQSWDSYPDFFKKRFLPAVRGKTVIFLGGDVHHNVPPNQISDWPIEVVSSGAALFEHNDPCNFGVLDVSNDIVRVVLFSYGEKQYGGKIDLKTGSLKTSVAALAGRVRKPTVQRAIRQRRNALRRLYDQK